MYIWSSLGRKATKKIQKKKRRVPQGDLEHNERRGEQQTYSKGKVRNDTMFHRKGGGGNAQNGILPSAGKIGITTKLGIKAASFHRKVVDEARN